MLPRQALHQKMGESRVSYMAVQGNHEGREVIAKVGIAIGVSGSQRVGKLVDKVETR